MKNKILFLVIVCLSSMGIRDCIAQDYTNNESDVQEETGQNDKETYSSSSSFVLFSDVDVHESRGDGGAFYAPNPWGGGDDAPNPEDGDLSTSGAAPIKDGILLLLMLIGIYTITVSYRKEKR